MKKLFLVMACIFGAISLPIFANDSEFCMGFIEGYKTIRGDMAMLPMCPMEPMTPMGSTPYREGIKAGMRAANRGF